MDCQKPKKIEAKQKQLESDLWIVDLQVHVIYVRFLGEVIPKILYSIDYSLSKYFAFSFKFKACVKFCQHLLNIRDDEPFILQTEWDA